MTKLSDLQLILLTGASQREDWSILPVPDTVADQPKRVHPAIAGLLKRGLIDERADVRAPQSWRTEDERHYGVVINEQGLQAIGVEDTATEPAPSPSSVRPAPNTSSAPAARAGSKQAQLIALLSNKAGISITDLAEALSWLPHTTRAALTGLRKKGHAIDKSSRDGVTVYAMKAAA